jgi:hypothetical protein
MKYRDLPYALLLAFAYSISLYGQQAAPEQTKLLPCSGFPSVAVVMLDDQDVLQILLPSPTVPVPDSASFVVQRYVVENGVQVLREQTHHEAYLPDKFRMVRTQLSGDKIKLRDQSGNILSLDQIAKSIRKPTHVVLVEGGQIDSCRIQFIRKEAIVLNPSDLDPNCWYEPDAVNLDPKWVRTEPMPIPAVARIVENTKFLEVEFISRKTICVPERRTRTVTDKNGEQTVQEFDVQVCKVQEENLTERLPIQDCLFSTISGKPIELEKIANGLSQPKHVLWDSTITSYLGSVVKPEVILVKPKTPKLASDTKTSRTAKRSTPSAERKVKKKEPSAEDTRTAALKIIDLGGCVNVMVNGTHYNQIRNAEALPKSDFRLLYAGFWHLHSISDDDLVCLEGMPFLNGIGLDNTSVTDGALKYYENCDKLIRVELSGTKVTEKGLEQLLENCPGIREVTLSDLPITDRIMPLIGRCSFVWAQRTKVTNEGLRHFSGHSIDTLLLDETAITDEGLKHFAGTSISKLGLAKTAVTDVGLSHLSEVKHIAHLILTGTAVTDVGVATFKDKFPNCIVVR